MLELFRLSILFRLPLFAQASPFDFTSGIRRISSGASYWSIAPDPDGSGCCTIFAVRTSYDARWSTDPYGEGSRQAGNQKVSHLRTDRLHPSLLRLQRRDYDAVGQG